MRLNLALSVFLFCVITFASCSIEERIYEEGYHISWLHPKPNNHLADVSQGRSEGASQDLPQDLSQNLSRNLETTVSLDLPQNTAIQSISDTITPTNKEDDYFGQKDYTHSNQNASNPKSDKPQNISELKKETSDNFKVALFGFVGWAVSLGLLSMNNWSTLDSIKAAIFFIFLGVICALLFFIYFPMAIFRLFKLIFLKMRGKPDEYQINQPRKKD